MDRLKDGNHLYTVRAVFLVLIFPLSSITVGVEIFLHHESAVMGLALFDDHSQKKGNLNHKLFIFSIVSLHLLPLQH